MNRFPNFPKKRPELPDEYKKIYKSQYKENREGRTIFSRFSLKAESWQHIEVAKDTLSNNNITTLEIGAGTLNHLPYEINNAAYDIIEPHKELYEDSELLPHIRNIYSDISIISLTTKYDRIISCNTFEHICNLPEVVAKCCLLLKKDGVVRIGIPSEGNLLWTLTWKLTRGIEFKMRYGLDYDVLMKYEHVNTAREVEKVLDYFFDRIETKVMGLSKSLSLYQLYICSSPCEIRCNEYLDIHKTD